MTDLRAPQFDPNLRTPYTDSTAPLPPDKLDEILRVLRVKSFEAGARQITVDPEEITNTAKTAIQALISAREKEAVEKNSIKMLTRTDRKYLLARAMRADDRSMVYIAKKIGYKHASGINYLLKQYPRKELLDSHFSLNRLYELQSELKALTNPNNKGGK